MSRERRPKGDGEIIPIGILVVGLVIGGYFLTNQPLTDETAYLRVVFVGLSVLGVLYVGIGFHRKSQQEDLHSAVNWLFGTHSTSQRSTSSEKSTEKTPPPPESLKNELYFERADRRCEWCGERVNSPDVHHIQPRSEGGSNDPENLIVLCPNCHRKADGGTISRSKLKYRVTEQLDERRT